MKAKKLTKETILDTGTLATNALDAKIIGARAADKVFPDFKVGDTIEVALIIKEGNKERIQKFMGDVICDHNNGISSTFTVRRMSANNVNVEKIFPYHSPMIDSVKLVKRGKVRRAKLYYIRERIGKAARIKEKIQTKAEKEAAAAKK